MIRIMRTLLLILLAAGVARAQVLYSNGTDPGTYSWQINFGYAVTDSFVLSGTSHVDQVVLSVWDVDDLNNPMTSSWKITTEPFGGQVVASGTSFLGLVQPCVQNRRLFCQWEMSININATLPGGTYWLQVDNMQTKFGSDAFWGQSSGPSHAYLSAGPNAASNAVRAIPSESFQVLGTPQ